MATRSEKFKEGDIVQILPLPESELYRISDWNRGRYLIKGSGLTGIVTYNYLSNGVINGVKIYHDGKEDSISWPEDYMKPADFLHRMAFDIEKLKCDVEQLKYPEDD